MNWNWGTIPMDASQKKRPPAIQRPGEEKEEEEEEQPDGDVASRTSVRSRPSGFGAMWTLQPFSIGCPLTCVCLRIKVVDKTPDMVHANGDRWAHHAHIMTTYTCVKRIGCCLA